MSKLINLRDLQYHCEGLTGIHHIYQRLLELFPETSPADMKEHFLWSIKELMEQGKLKFLGEGWVKDGSGIHAKYMFNDDVESWPKDRMTRFWGCLPVDTSPNEIEGIIRSKWPYPDTKPFDHLGGSHDWLWFDKWNFEWVERKSSIDQQS